MLKTDSFNGVLLRKTYFFEINNIQELIHNSSDVEKIKQLEERLLKVQQHLDDVEKKKEEIHTLQNGKAGYIYIISIKSKIKDKKMYFNYNTYYEDEERQKELLEERESVRQMYKSNLKTTNTTYKRFLI